MAFKSGDHNSHPHDYNQFGDNHWEHFCHRGPGKDRCPKKDGEQPTRNFVGGSRSFGRLSGNAMRNRQCFVWRMALWSSLGKAERFWKLFVLYLVHNASSIAFC